MGSPYFGKRSIGKYLLTQPLVVNCGNLIEFVQSNLNLNLVAYFIIDAARSEDNDG